MKNILTGAAITFILLSLASVASAQEVLKTTQVDCSTENTKQILLQKLGGEANIPFNIDIDNQIRSLRSCPATDAEIQTLADTLRTMRERQDSRQMQTNSIEWQGQVLFVFSLVLGVALAVFIAIKRRRYGTALIVGGLTFYFLAELTFYFNMVRLAALGTTGPPFALVIFSGIVLPIIIGLSIVGYIVDIVLARRRRSPR